MSKALSLGLRNRVSLSARFRPFDILSNQKLMAPIGVEAARRATLYGVR